MHIGKYLKKIPLIVSLPVVVLIAGTIGFMILEHLSFLDALYFTVSTISTVGYGDITPSTTAGKIFGMLLIITGIGSFLAIVSHYTQRFLQRGQDRMRRQRLNMIIGVFFTEVGFSLLELLAKYDPDIGSIREECVIGQQWNENDFARLRKKLRKRDNKIDSNLVNLQQVLDFLNEKGDLLLRQIENPDLLEHGAFTELLWATVHLRDELISRKKLSGLPENDVMHLSNDAARVYGSLVRQWLDYLLHLKREYPYLFSLAVRNNPFIDNPDPTVT